MSKFVSVNYHVNNIVCHNNEVLKYRKLTSGAYEITLVNKKLIELKSDSRSFTEHKLNNINYKANGLDCPIGP